MKKKKKERLKLGKCEWIIEKEERRRNVMLEEKKRNVDVMEEK